MSERDKRKAREGLRSVGWIPNNHLAGKKKKKWGGKTSVQRRQEATFILKKESCVEQRIRKVKDEMRDVVINEMRAMHRAGKWERNHSGEISESGRRIFHIHLLSSSGLFRWQRRKIAAGVLSLSLSPVLPLILYSFLLALSMQLFFSAFTVQFLMYRDGVSLHWCTNNAYWICARAVHILLPPHLHTGKHKHMSVLDVHQQVYCTFAQIK